MVLPRWNKSPTDTAFSQQQFIPGEGIDMRVLRTYMAYNFGDNVELKPAVNSLDGKEGFIIKRSILFRPEDLKLLQQQSQDLRSAEKVQNHEKYFEKLHQGWAQHQHYLDHEAQIQSTNSVPTQRIDRNLPIPFLDLPPAYNDVEGLHSNKRSIQPLQQTVSEGMPRMDSGQRPRPVSCSDLNFFSPSGGFYPDGYYGSEDTNTSDYHGQSSSSQSLQANGPDPTFSQPVEAHGVTSLGPTWHVYGTGTFDRSRGAPLARARSAACLRTNNYGLAHRPSQRSGIASEELFLGSPGSSVFGSGQRQLSQGPALVRAHSDGLPVWA